LTPLTLATQVPFRRPPRRLEGEHVVLGFVAAAVVVLALMPVARLAMTALWPAGTFDPAPFLAEVGRRQAVRALWRSLETSVYGGLGALAIGTGAAFLAALTDVRGSRAFAFLFVLSAMMAPQVVALAFLTMTGPASPLLNTLGLAPAPGTPNSLHGAFGIVLLLSLHHAPLVFITVRAGLRNLPRDLVEAGRAAGAGPGRVLVAIVLPLVAPYVFAAALIAFVAAVGNFGIPALLGLPANYLTLPTLIYTTLASGGPAVLADISSLAMMVTLLAVVALAIAFAAGRRPAARLAAFAPAEQVFALGWMRWPATLLLWTLIAAVVALPALSLVTAALVPAYGVPLTFASATIDNFVEVLVRQPVTGRALRNSALFAGGAAALLAFAAIPFAHAIDRRGGRTGRLVTLVFELPYALPGVVLAVAMILMFLKPLPIIGVSLYATPAIIIVAYLARFASLALKAPAAAIAQLPRDLEEAASAAGAGYIRRQLAVVAPLAAPAAVAGGLIVFLTAFNELTVSALLWSAGTETMGVVLFNLEDGGYATLASAVGIVSIVVVTLAMLIIDRLGRKLPRGVVPWR
jgi:iron(III) transport system permease protein